MLALHPGFPGASVVKDLPANAGEAGDLGSIPGWGRSPGGGNGNPLQYSCLGNPMDRGARWATVHKVTKSWTWLHKHTHTQLSVSLSLLSLISRLLHWQVKKVFLPWSSYNCVPFTVIAFFRRLEISGNNGTDKYLFIHTLLSPGVRLRWKLRELDKNSGISKKEATNEQSGRSNFFPVHGAGIVFIWVRRQIIFHVDDTW